MNILSTYRVQLSPEQGFEAASHRVAYLSRLGVSHMYCSPYLQAAKGSTHGYDVVDHSKVSEDLGGQDAHDLLCRTLRDAGMGQVVDVVPNHMAVSGPENLWWWDVLENGQRSRFADYFDVDWQYAQESDNIQNRVLLPILGDHYGRVLESGEIQLLRTGGSFHLQYYDHQVPVDPRSLSELLFRAASRIEHAELAFLASALDYLPLPKADDRVNTRRRHHDKEVIRNRLSILLEDAPQVKRAVDAEVDLINSDHDRLDELLEKQNYRLAYWRIARSDLGYRRFFDINDLIAIRVEDEDVFTDTHGLVLSWIREGKVDGIRVDHPDGLRDPEEYFQRLRHRAGDAWIVGEKILAPEERMPDSWPIHGTTGYDFLNDLHAVILDSRNGDALSRVYASFTGETIEYAPMLHQSKLDVLHDLLGSDVNRLTEMLLDISYRNRRYRDFSKDEVHDALCEVLASFSVYRTYIRAEIGTIRDSDRTLVHDAIVASEQRRNDLDAELFAFLRRILTLDLDGVVEHDFVMRFQQLSGPVMAKGAEDTTFYRYHRWIALNEVGAEPERFGMSVEQFHGRMIDRSTTLPRSMLTTSTHDTKRSEDTRARLLAISEVPDEWENAVQTWSSRAHRYRTGEWPDRNTEYFIFQTLAGTWPISIDRITEYLEKAIRESKEYTSWTEQNQAYEDAVLSFARSVLSDSEICTAIESFVERISPGGYVNSLVQTAVKLLGPGVPDIYQGCETWNFTLVDPDNRRPVDYDALEKMLDEVESFSAEQLIGHMKQGHPKLALTRALLRTRRIFSEVFRGTASKGPGPYVPTSVRGEASTDVLSFSRGEDVYAVCPLRFLGRNGSYPDTSIELPEGPFRNVVTGDVVAGGIQKVDTLIARFPVCVLVRWDGQL